MAKSRSHPQRHDLKAREHGASGDQAAARGATEDAAETGGDAGMFRAAVGDVRPLAPTGRAIDHESSAPKARTRRAPAARLRPEPAQELALLPDSVAPEDIVGGTDPMSHRRPGVRDQVMRRLRRGLYPVEDQLDLHGLNQAAARDALSEFLEFNRSAGHRCVRIVHGKGYRSGARGPILKIAVNAWLKRHSDVLAFTSARAIDGGTGAVYVLLRGA
ncbi:MAG: Smr/MutS family protein [Steroidobacteraceae bacterium]|jgi:DNA-nicking Smr family endonuclease